MKVVILALGLAVVLAVLADAVFNYLERLLGIDHRWHWLVLLLAGLMGLALIAWALIPRKKAEWPIVTTITDKTGTREEVVKQSSWERFKEWWESH